MLAVTALRLNGVRLNGVCPMDIGRVMMVKMMN